MKEFEKKGSPSREGFSKFLPASMSDSGTRRRLTEYEIQVQDLQAYVRSLEAETVHLRKKLEDSPKEFMVLENKLREANRQLVQAFNQNEKLVNALYEAREQITALKEEVDKLCAPPSTYGVYLAANEDNTVTILSQGRKVKVNLHPALKPELLKPGQELILNEGLNVIEAADVRVPDVGHLLERKVLDLALGKALEQITGLRIHQDVVADLQACRAQGVGDDADLLFVGAERDDRAVTVELLLEDHDFALDFEARDVDDVQAFVQDQLLTRPERRDDDRRMRVDLGLASLGEDVHGAVVVGG